MAVSKSKADQPNLNSISNTPSWKSCKFCSNKIFSTSSEFTKHLRDNHCSQEGGSFVCHYGYNGVCTSLPVEGVSDKDYEDHVTKHHSKLTDGKEGPGVLGMFSTTPLQGHLYRLSLLSDGAVWNVNAACQNMAAILNDPKKGKQKDFFTRTWGDSFVENTDIPPSHLLPSVDESFFIPYLKKLAKRNRTPIKRQSSSLFLENFAPRHSFKVSEGESSDLKAIPKAFLQSNLDLSQPETFYNVFPFIKESGVFRVLECRKTLQEKWSHYLDLIELQIAHQIAHKSDAFFQAVASHDTVRDELGKALEATQGLRHQVKEIDRIQIQGSLKILHCRLRRQNAASVCKKLLLMATIHQTQPTIQLLLSTSDYVGALDLINTTQEVVQQELLGVNCFRYLNSQLKEMENLIEKMLSSEFERVTTAELNRPLMDETLVVEEDRLTAVLSGMLRQQRYSFIDLFKDEALTAMKALIKQSTVEALAANDIDVDRGLLLDQLKHLNFTLWTNLMQQSMINLIALLHRVRAIHDIMINVVTMANVDRNEQTVSEEERLKLQQSLKEMLNSICDSAHDQCGRLLSSRTKDTAMLERVSSQEFVALAQLIEKFVTDCEQITGHKAMGLRLAFQGHASRFVQKFHEERRGKLSAVLDSERWRQADFSVDVQEAIDKFLMTSSPTTSTHVSNLQPLPSEKEERKETVVVNGDPYVVVEAALFFLPQIFEYCNCVDNIPAAAPDLLTRLVELLKTFNSRTCQLVLGAGALSLVGLKTISSRNLALASRSLQLISFFIPLLKAHFDSKLSPKQKSLIKHFDQAYKDFGDHIVEIENKLMSILADMTENCLATWEIKPPIPSPAFRTISKQLTKFHEAISPVWPLKDIQNFYTKFNVALKRMLKNSIHKRGVQNDGGPQHGIVTSEVLFYVKNLKPLNVLQNEESVESFSEDLWN